MSFQRKNKELKIQGGMIMALQKTTKEIPACPVETTLTLIGDKWKVLIRRDLMAGTCLLYTSRCV